MFTSQWSTFLSPVATIARLASSLASFFSVYLRLGCRTQERKDAQAWRRRDGHSFRAQRRTADAACIAAGNIAEHVAQGSRAAS